MKSGVNTKMLNKKIGVNLFLNIFAVILVGFFLKGYLRENYRLNVTSSLPVGIYKIDKIDEVKKGDKLTFKIPNDVKQYMLDRNYINKSVISFLKRVGALEGDNIEVGNNLVINGEIIKPILKKDTLGRDLPVKYGKYKLKSGEFFMLGDTLNSFDSCYIGIVKEEQLEKKAKLILEIGGGKER